MTVLVVTYWLGRVWDVRNLTQIVAEVGDSSAALEQGQRETLDFYGETVAEFIGSEKGKSCLRGEFLHNKSATAAYWDPRGRQIVSTSYDDTLRCKYCGRFCSLMLMAFFCTVWSLDAASLDQDKSFKSFEPISKIRHNCQTGKWVSLLKAQWTKNPDIYPHFTVCTSFFIPLILD